MRDDAVSVEGVDETGDAVDTMGRLCSGGAAAPDEKEEEEEEEEEEEAVEDEEGD